MALKIDDEASALARACAFGGQPYRGLIGPNERQIPAVRAPDGSLIYLLESGAPGQSNYDIDFRLHAVASAGTGLQRIDHMATALPAESLASCCFTAVCSTSRPTTSCCCPIPTA